MQLYQACPPSSSAAIDDGPAAPLFTISCSSALGGRAEFLVGFSEQLTFPQLLSMLTHTDAPPTEYDVHALGQIASPAHATKLGMPRALPRCCVALRSCAELAHRPPPCADAHSIILEQRRRTVVLSELGSVIMDLVSEFASACGYSTDQLLPTTPFMDMGLDSLDMLKLARCCAPEPSGTLCAPRLL